jgi:hypothetical protein
MRPTFLTNYLRISTPMVRAVSSALDGFVGRRHARREDALVGRSASC